ncbi:Ig-like domain-containing protein [Anoxybacillus salavatliensis]|uniref:Ig-like domain-containing protein n=1 Tax=Anoxybacillus gonensis TaxID=198467 RepID=UPI00214C6076|nr:Ig-like domain-containing protein [Anoxybacillus gonensis]
MKFNTAMDKDSVTDVTKYSIKRAGVASVALTNNSTATDATASLSEDGKTLTITLDNALTSATWGSIAEGDTFNLEHSKLKAVNGNEIAASSLSVKYSDKVAPNLVSATAKAATSTKTVTLKFSEPVDFTTTGVFKVNGQVATPSAGSDVREVVLTTSQNLTAGQTYTVEVTNLKDLAGNLITPNPVSLDFTVVQDNTADGIESVTVQGDNKVKVVFKESMNSSTVTTAGNIKLVDANGNPITNVTVSTGANSKEYTINVGSGTNLYANADTNTVNIIFTNAIKDATGNAITPETRTVTFTKDKVAPKVSKVQLIAPGDTYDGVPYPNGALLLTFDEKVVRPADGGTPGDLALSKIQVIDQDGTDVTSSLFGPGPNISSTVLDSNDNAKLVIPFTTAPASTVKTATVRLVASAVTDASLGTNGNEAATVTGVDFTTSVADTTKPVVSGVAGGAGNTITFIVTEANLDKATVLDINNYRLDGTPLPAGSYVTISTAGSTHTVTVHLPAGSISKTRTNYAFTISGIKDKAGNTADVVAVNNVSLTDDVQPVLTAGKLNADGTITLTYSEAVTGTVAGDLEVKLNGYTVDSSVLTVSDITEGSDNGGTLVKIAVGFDAGTGAAGDEIIFIDVAGGTAGAYDAGTDILLATGTYANAAAYNGGYILASDVVTLKVSTAATGTLTGQDAVGNKLANGKSVTIK